MNKLERVIKRERRQKYKRLRKLRKARDMASKYTDNKLLLSNVYKFIRFDNVDEYLFTSDLAKHMLDMESWIIGKYPPRPPKPKSHSVQKQSITILPDNYEEQKPKRKINS